MEIVGNSMYASARFFLLVWLLPLTFMASGAAAQTYDIRATYLVTRGGNRGTSEPIPLDAKDMRLQAATRNLAELAGHPVMFQIDAALLPALHVSITDAIIQAVENTTQDLGLLHDKRVDVFAFVAPRLQRIECNYDAGASEPSFALDDRQPVLRAKLPPTMRQLVPQGEVRYALVAAWERRQESIYANRPPQTVPAAEHQAYFKFLTSPRRGYLSYDELNTVEGLNRDSVLETLLKIAHLFELSRDPILRGQMQKWLAHSGMDLQDLADRHSEAAKASPPNSPFRQAQRVWVEWLQANKGTLDESQNHELIRILFHERPGIDRQLAYVTIPGLDPLQFGLDLMQDLAPASATRETISARAKLAEQLLCPREGTRSNAYCGREFYQYTLRVADSRSRLAKALSAKEQDRLTETVVFNIGSLGKNDDLIELNRGLEPNERQWSVAMRTAAQCAERSHAELYVDELARLWRAYPSPPRRGAVLYVLSRIELSVPDAVPGTKFSERFGSRVSAAEYGAFLDQDPRAMASQRLLWKILSPGWSQVAVLVSRLDAWLDNGSAGLSEQHDRLETLRTITEHYCQVTGQKELRQLHDFFLRRIEHHPSELGLQELVSALAAPRCGRRAARQAGTKGGKTGAGPLFGD